MKTIYLCLIFLLSGCGFGDNKTLGQSEAYNAHTAFSNACSSRGLNYHAIYKHNLKTSEIHSEITITCDIVKDE